MKLIALALLLSLSAALPALAEHPHDCLNSFDVQAKEENPSFPGFDANRGKQFFISTHGGDWSCSSCHTTNPMAAGKHIVTQKSIEPLAPAANSDRFTNMAKIERWFKRNCKDVVGRECSVQEKGDVLAFLLTQDLK